MTFSCIRYMYAKKIVSKVRNSDGRKKKSLKKFQPFKSIFKFFSKFLTIFLHVRGDFQKFEKSTFAAKNSYGGCFGYAVYFYEDSIKIVVLHLG